LKKSGSAVLPLHGGHAPSWLISRMKSLAAEIVTVIVDEYGRDELLLRLSDPFWFQSLGCVLGYDWHSSGVTTVLTGVLREAVDPASIGVAVCGGKGRRSNMTPTEIHQYGSQFKLSEQQVDGLEHASKLAAKVDNAAIQAGYPLYHHAFFMTIDGKWAVIQQGMDASDRTARRYHWLSEHVHSFVVEPHDAIVGDTVRPTALDMTSKDSEESRKVSVDLVKDGTVKLRNEISSLRSGGQKLLTEWMNQTPNPSYTTQVLNMPRHIDWDAMKRAYDFQPSNYEELLSVHGIGPGAVRALALVSQVIYGAKPSWHDPVKFSFALGGKDGVPFPVDRSSYDQTIDHLGRLIEKARLEEREKYAALKRLKAFVPV
jgi:hypothetical protein